MSEATIADALLVLTAINFDFNKFLSTPSCRSPSSSEFAIPSAVVSKNTKLSKKTRRVYCSA